MSKTIRKAISLGIIFAFWANTITLMPLAHADEFRLPAPGVMISLSPAFNPSILNGIKVHPDNPFRFDFILEKGDSELSNDQLKEESSKLIKYFLACLTIPEKDLWVNLSPYEKDRIIPSSFGLTEMGRDLLAEDYMLKQITASLIYPEGETGKKFWKRIYEEAARKYGTTNIPVNTFNKVWIVPEKAVVFENAAAGTAYVVDSRLKVMLEQDYLALSKNTTDSSSHQDTSTLGSGIVREVVIPQLTAEINKNKNFARLRQVYNSLILATWYKKKIKDSILSKIYSNKNKVEGINISDPQEKEKIYQQYLKAFKKGVFNFIKQESDNLSQEIIPRKYFSGGVDFAMNATNLSQAQVVFVHDPASIEVKDNGQTFDASVELAPFDHAMSSKWKVRENLLSMTNRVNPGKRGIGNAMFSRYFPSVVPVYLPTWEVALEAIAPYYDSGEQFTAELPVHTQMPATFAEIPNESEKGLEVGNIILTSRFHSGGKSLVRLAFAEDGRPVALKTPDDQMLQRSGTTVEQYLLNEYSSFKTGEELGIGPHVYGVYKDKEDGWGLVIDFVPGDFTEVSEHVGTQTVRDLIEIRRRLYANHLTFYNDFQFYIMPNGHIRCIDLMGLGQEKSTRQESEYRFFESLRDLFVRLDLQSQTEAIREMDADLVKAFNAFLIASPASNQDARLFDAHLKSLMELKDQAMTVSRVESRTGDHLREIVGIHTKDVLPTAMSRRNFLTFALGLGVAAAVSASVPAQVFAQGNFSGVDAKSLNEFRFFIAQIKASTAVSLTTDGQEVKNAFGFTSSKFVDLYDVLIRRFLSDQNGRKVAISESEIKPLLVRIGEDILAQHMRGLASLNHGNVDETIKQFNAKLASAKTTSDMEEVLSQFELYVRQVADKSHENSEKLFKALNNFNAISISKGFVIDQSPLGLEDEKLIVLYKILKTNIHHLSNLAVPAYHVRQVTKFADKRLRGNNGWSGFFTNYVIVFDEAIDQDAVRFHKILTQPNESTFRASPTARNRNLINSLAALQKMFLQAAFPEKQRSVDYIASAIKEITSAHEVEHKIRAKRAGFTEGSFVESGKEEVAAILASMIRATHPVAELARMFELAAGSTDESGLDFSWQILKAFSGKSTSEEIIKWAKEFLNESDLDGKVKAKAVDYYKDSFGDTPLADKIDHAMLTETTAEYGGIDLTPSKMNLQTENQGGEIKFHMNPAMLAQLQNASGFVPVNINIQPMTDIKAFLEVR